jgi:3-methyladenine DNA glycosylase Tag
LRARKFPPRFEGSPDIARGGKRDVARLMNDAGIIRSAAKIDAAIAGARLWLPSWRKS